MFWSIPGLRIPVSCRSVDVFGRLGAKSIHIREGVRSRGFEPIEDAEIALELL
jgi:hypothetical protein